VEAVEDDVVIVALLVLVNSGGTSGDELQLRWDRGMFICFAILRLRAERNSRLTQPILSVCAEFDGVVGSVEGE
jgi:hypothetical protein